MITGIFLIVIVISSTAFAKHGVFLNATKVNITEPKLLSLVPGVYIGVSVFAPVKVPSPLVLHCTPEL